jgi:hypothetical protein
MFRGPVRCVGLLCLRRSRRRGRAAEPPQSWRICTPRKAVPRDIFLVLLMKHVQHREPSALASGDEPGPHSRSREGFAAEWATQSPFHICRRSPDTRAWRGSGGLAQRHGRDAEPVLYASPPTAQLSEHLLSNTMLKPQQDLQMPDNGRSNLSFLDQYGIGSPSAGDIQGS